jgi:hypothetical protein
MIVLADNDIVHKLACCELLPEFQRWLKVPPTEVWVLPALQFVVRRKLKGDASAMAGFEAFLRNVRPIPIAQLSTLSRFEALDVGERQLIAVLVDKKEVTQLITGDKRALKLIGTLTAADSGLALRLGEARIDCLESVMLGMISAFGFDAINAKVLPGLKHDGVLGLSFGARRTQAHATEALKSYLGAVRADAPFVANG